MTSELWSFLPIGYLATIAIEIPILLIGLSRRHSLRDRLIAGFWLTACTYPIVVLVLPSLMVDYERWQFLLVAETFAPVAECSLFWLAYGEPGGADRRGLLRDFVTIVLANLASFTIGELMQVSSWALPLL